MKAHQFLTLVLLTVFSSLQAQTIYNTVKDGFYTDPTVWDQNAVPLNGGNTTINIQHDLVLPSSFVGGVASNWKLVVKTGGKLTVYGNLDIDLNATSSIEVEENGALIATNLILEDGSFISTGTVTLDTMSLAGSHTTLVAGGDIDISGQLLIEGTYDSSGYYTTVFVDNAVLTTALIKNTDGYLRFRTSQVSVNSTTSVIENGKVEVDGGTYESISTTLSDRSNLQLAGRSEVTLNTVNLFDTTSITGFGDGGILNTTTVTIAGAGAFINCVDEICNYTQGATVPNELDLLTGAAILPVVWDQVTARWTNGDVRIDWATAQEANNEYFLIERTTDAKITWDVIGEVNAVGNSQDRTDYRFLDTEAIALEAKTIFYRIRQVDFDGTESYAPIVFVTTADLTELDAKPTFTIAPNPVIDQFRLLLPTEVTNASILLHDAQGRHHLLNGRFSGQELNLSFPTDLAAGIYIIEVQASNYRHQERLYYLR